MEKRGQITQFIILGVLILLAVSLGIYLYVRNSSDILDRAAQDTLTESLPSSLLPFKRYVEECTADVLERGVRAAGANGGVIYPKELGLEFNYYNPTESDGVAIFPDGNLNVLYWSYIQGDNECKNGCTQWIQPPPLVGDVPGSIESQIETFVENNVDVCIKAAEQLQSIGIYATKAGDPSAEITFTDSGVAVKLDYPFALQRDDDTGLARYYRATYDVPFQHYYDDASFLLAMLNYTKAFEKQTLALISLYSGMDTSKFPPKAGSDTEFVSTLAWVVPQVQQGVQQTMTSYIPFFTLNGSRNFHPVDEFYTAEYYTLKNRVFREFTLPAPEQYAQYNVDFMYNNWPMYFNINDGEQVLMPESASIDWFPWFGINRIRTMYSISYPVVVSLSNPEDDGFTFNFAVETNIRNNAPMDAEYVPFDYSQFDDLVPGKTYFCDFDQRTSEPVWFKVVNGINYSAEKGVALTYVCGDETCPIGITDDSGIFYGQLPICAGGSMQLLKQEFHTQFIPVTPSIDFAKNLSDIVFEPYRHRNITIKRLPIVKNTVTGDWYARSGTSSIDSKEQVVVQLTRVQTGLPTNWVSEEFNTFSVVDGITQKGEIRLLPGLYEGTLTSVLSDPVRFLPNERCIEYRKLFKKEKECYFVPEEEFVMDQYAGGGAVFGENTKLLYISKDQLDSSSTIELREIFIDIPAIPEDLRVIEDLEYMGKIEEYSQQYANDLGPYFS